MDPLRIFHPLLALVALTFSVLLLIPITRVRAGFARRVTFDDFTHGESAQVPPEVRIPNRNYMNLLELPQLFSVLAVVLYVTDRVDALQYALAWVYVALRVGHSLVHLTYNRVPHRLVVFAVSNFVLFAMWLRFASTLL
jgi:hypothetical protein